VSDSSGPTEVDCDAPPYAIVRACARLGFRSPPDVRWRRLTPRQQPGRWTAVLLIYGLATRARA
jgi:hypothetical protein